MTRRRLRDHPQLWLVIAGLTIIVFVFVGVIALAHQLKDFS